MRTYILILLVTYSISLSSQYGIQYGSPSSEEAGSLIRTDATSVYVVGGTLIGSTEYAIISKFTKGSYVKLWEKRLDFPSRINDFIVSPSGDLIVVGQSVMDNDLANNESFYLKVSTSDGSFLCTKKYNHMGPEAFTRIVLHGSPLDPAYPYYILGRKQNPSLGESSFDIVTLWNVNDNCNGANFIKWSKEYRLDNDSEFHRGLVASIGGDLLLTGNRVATIGSTAAGLIVKINGNGNLLLSKTLNDNIRINDGVLSPSNLVLVGEHTFSSGSKKACSFLIDNGLNLIYAHEVNSLESFERVSKPLTSPFISPLSFHYSTARRSPDLSGKNNTSCFVEFSNNNGWGFSIGSINHVTGSEYISDNIHFDTNGFFYTDGKKSPLGLYDIRIFQRYGDFFGTCFDSINSENIVIQPTLSEVFPVANNYTPPSPNSFSNIAISLPTEAFCGQPCNIQLTTTKTLNDNCGSVTFTGIATGGTSPYTYSWDVNCNSTIEGTINPLTITIGPGTQPYCVTVTDATGCTAVLSNQTVVGIVDNKPPVIICPPNIKIPCGSDIFDTSITGLATATDNADPSLTISVSFGTTAISECNGTTIYTFTATDDCGNSSTCSQIISSTHDETPPIISNCGRKVILNGVIGPNGNCGLNTVVTAPDVSDNCDGMLTLTNSFNPTDEDASGYYPVGTTIVKWTAVDDCGNMTMCNDTIIILPCGGCQGLSASLTPITTQNGKCCYALNLNNGQGPGVVDGICLDVINPDWIMNTVSLASGYTFTAGSASGGFLCIENASGIPFGLSSNVATICMAEISTVANDTQCIQISWINDASSIGCLDTLKTYCKPPIQQKDTCFAISNLVIECDPKNDYAYCVSMDVTNLSSFSVANFILDALPTGYNYGNCTTCPPGLSSGSAFGSGGDWYWNWFGASNDLDPGDTRTICFQITSTSPVLTSTTICTLGSIESTTKCCHSPKPVCFTLKPCCDPCDEISVNLTPLQNQDTCCYRLNVDYTCDYKVFDKLELDLLTPGVHISSFGLINSAWTPMVSIPGHKICFTPNSGYVTSSNDGALFNFCITGVDDPSEVPQYLNINYYGNINQKDTILCDTLLRLECEDEEQPCVIVTDQKVKCDSNKYIITMNVTNNSSPAFTATELLIFSGPTITPYPITFAGSGLASGSTQTVTFCYIPPTFPDPDGILDVVYKLKDAMGNCCEGGEELNDTIILPPCDNNCYYTQCGEIKHQFDVEGKPIGDLPNVIHTGVFPVQNFPQVVNDGCNGTGQSVLLHGVTRGYSGDAIGVKHGGIIGSDTLCKSGETCCLKFCEKIIFGAASTSTMVEITLRNFSTPINQLVGYYTFSNNTAWQEFQVFITPSSDVREVRFRNVTTDPLDGPPGILIDDIRISSALVLIDVTPPVISCPANITINDTDGDCTIPYTMPSIAVSDDNMVASFSCTLNGIPINAGDIVSINNSIVNTVTCIARDTCDNIKTCSYTITVECQGEQECKCPDPKTTIVLSSGGSTYNIKCGDAKIPRLDCPIADVLVSGVFACKSDSGLCNNIVSFELDRPGSLPSYTGSSSTSPSFNFNFNIAEIGTPGLYTMTIYTKCPGSLDTCKCVINWIQENCDSLCACSLDGVAKPNLVTNGTFSLGNIGFTSDLTNSVSCSANTYLVDDMASDKCGSWGAGLVGNPGNFMMIDGFNAGTNLNLWSQSVPLLAGSTYTLCFETAKIFSDNPFNINVGIVDGASNYYSMGIVNISALTWTQHTLSITIPTGSVGPYTLQINQVGIDIQGFSDMGLDNICFTEQKKDECVCDGFKNTKFCIPGQAPIFAKCNEQNVVYTLPCPSIAPVFFCGKFLCKPDTCTPNKINYNIKNLTTGSAVSAGLLASAGFSLQLLPGWFTNSGDTYEVTVKGMCGIEECICKVKFKFEQCPQKQSCKCDQQFFADVASGFLQSSLVGVCQRKFEPIKLCPTDKVTWTLNGVVQTNTTGMTSTSFTINASPIRNTVCMIVTRTESPNVVCRDTFCQEAVCYWPDGSKCPSPTNGGFENGIVGKLGEDGSMPDWNLKSGEVHVITDEGISDGNLLFLAVKRTDGSMVMSGIIQDVQPNNSLLIDQISFDAENYLDKPLPQGSTIEFIGYRQGKPEVVATFDASIYRKGWDGSIKNGIAKKFNYDRIECKLFAPSPEYSMLRIDNICFDFITATEEEMAEENIKIYPNPSLGIFTIDFNATINRVVSIEIYDLYGRRLISEQIKRGDARHELDLSSSSSGVYIVRIKDQSGSRIERKIIKLD